MQLQHEISLQRISQWRGRTMTMLVEGVGSDETGRPLLVGRSFRDAPEVDGQVFAWGKGQAGDMCQVKINSTTEYDVWGKVI
jgi:ribosomal protein S12 methylthiotransferase